MSKIDTIYIAGYSRCGSTALSMALDQHTDIFNAGELAFLGADYKAEHRACSCGEQYPDCAFWGKLEGHLKELTLPTQFQKAVEDRRGFRALLHSGAFENSEAYGRRMKELFSWLREEANVPVILDASKSARATVGRALALHRLGGQQLGIIHLVRDPCATVRSYIDNGSNWALEGHKAALPLPGLRAAVGWAWANRAVERMVVAAPEIPFVRIRYEDLIEDPKSQLTRVAEKFELDMRPIQAAIADHTPLDGGHSVGGNRTRFAARPFEMKAPDPSPSLPPHHMAVLRLMAGDLMRKYGYSP